MSEAFEKFLKEQGGFDALSVLTQRDQLELAFIAGRLYEAEKDRARLIQTGEPQ